ncbi:hypothetical protein ACG83_00180 [Frankia sp. R43]|uniref:GMC family oxidoreductase n=1 Tax=Frankia sp. R43 TaxID=269536 RepID=UPI0006CA1967|nr:GMC oxidoreductase [Frankia sp. R43]KPM56423.1 hypothetical protein ACG83_00180 [Frankia sp. R43]
MSGKTPKVVIVGAGSAGLMLADGIADRADVTIVEGGIDPGSPAPRQLLYDYIFPAGLDWGYRSTKGVPLLRGKVVGGSSSVNSSAGVRGQQWDFDPWGEGWTWADCLPALRANETDLQFGDADHHGDSGPIVMTRLKPGPIDDAFTAACLAAGHPEAPDHNAPGALGIGPWPTNRVDEGRWGTLAGVMPGLRGRVTLLAETTAHRVVITDGRARGVEVTEAGESGTRVLPADVVVLSAGAFGTPELLIASGVDLPGVGEHLQDHPWVMLNALADPDLIAERPVSGSLLRCGLGGDPREEIQVFPFSAHLYDTSRPVGEVSFAVGLMAPRSRGSLRVTPDGTAIDLGHLAEEIDRRSLAEGVRIAADLLDRVAATGVVTIPDNPWWRGDDLEQQVVARAETYNHPVGTARLGDDDDPTAVVDRRLRVRGVDGLMVADASVMPAITRANTNLATMMIGRRAADLIEL